MGTSKTAARRLDAAFLKRETLRLRREGATHGEIADTLEISRSRVHKIVTDALERLARDATEETRQLRALEAERLDALQHALWDAGIDGDLQAVDRLLRIMERRAKLLGLDAPSKHAATTPDGEAVANAVIVVPRECEDVSQWVAEFGPNALEVDSEPQD
ncbi:sigma factor-like helix-turn-helix DNA-binding protein [Ectothiorhodospira variabilis]|uniref:sigma factor-like helix-turn-helix DNA-binding protein n=1 Tax=Ectothiorhodospira variabilis TaxID=505694 RepID=UPI001EFBAEDB|nr:sigma factor-like helix-turn-helix DNA-binding protein [Ectothiorhodospira variabilis]MCG5495245.1 hypothetical protein [Ectothiorhodospira variabilis]MCG5504205.1 hypothetical protein [Ectothiorhodospira variabilis]MCG5507360.1 hypothetical protein [Ectothiorhodospira variabilis]